MEIVPRRLAMFPLSAVLFPHEEMPLHIFEPRYRQLVTDCLETEREFGVVLIARGSEVGGGDERYPIGTIAHIEAASRFADGRWALVIRGTRRIRVTEWLDDDPYPVALIEEIPTLELHSECPELRRATAAVLRSRAILSELDDGPGRGLGVDAELGDQVGVASWRLCALAPLNPFDAHRLLMIDDPVLRLDEVAQHCEALADDLARLLTDG